MNKIQLFVIYDKTHSNKEFVELFKSRDYMIIRLNCNISGYKNHCSDSVSKRLLDFCIKYTCNPY